MIDSLRNGIERIKKVESSNEAYNMLIKQILEDH